MDIERYKKLAIPKIESGKLTKIVHDVIKNENIYKQDAYEGKKEEYAPLTKKIEEEIDEISKLREETNKMLELPQKHVEQLALPGPEQAQKMDSDFNAGFTGFDFEILDEYNLPSPSKVMTEAIQNTIYVEEILKQSGNLNNFLGTKQGNLSTTKVSKNKNKLEINNYKKKIRTIKKYRERIGIIPVGLQTLKKGKGVYTQPKRNAYKINPENGKYGNLIIDIPKLIGQLRLVAHQDKKKVYDKQVDFDTIDLLTKRFNTKKKYSPLSKMIFDDLNRISEIPIQDK